RGWRAPEPTRSVLRRPSSVLRHGVTALAWSSRCRKIMSEPSKSPPPPLDVAFLVGGIRAGERAALSRAITLIESKRSDHQKAARALVQKILPATGSAIRVGVTGMPGVGKSTTIDALGTLLTGKGRKV